MMLLVYLAAADIYVTPYLNAAQITSGTLSYAIGVGKPVVSTPYWHAEELLADDHGRLVPFGSSEGFAAALIELLDPPALRDTLWARAYARGRTMIWPRVGAENGSGVGWARVCQYVVFVSVAVS